MTDKQKRLLRMLDDGPLSTRQLVDAFGVSRANFPLATPDEIHAAMRRLEDREMVRRAMTEPIVWELTRQGRKVVDANS